MPTFTGRRIFADSARTFRARSSQLLHPFVRRSQGSAVYPESEMRSPESSQANHEHKVVSLHALGRRAGIPYEVERKVCAHCGRVLDERPLRRAAA